MEPGTLILEVDTKGGTGECLRVDIVVPDSYDDAHDRLDEAIKRYREKHTPPGREPGDSVIVTIESNVGGHAHLVMAQDSAPSDGEIVFRLAQRAVRDEAHSAAESGGPS